MGVDNINELVDCTKALPAQTPAYTSPDAALLETYVKGGIPEAAPAVQYGDLIQETEL